MNSMRRYQINIGLESTLVCSRIMGVHRKRPVVMKRWRKLSLYLHRAVNGKAIAKAGG